MLVWAVGCYTLSTMQKHPQKCRLLGRDFAKGPFLLTKPANHDHVQDAYLFGNVNGEQRVFPPHSGAETLRVL